MSERIVSDPSQHGWVEVDGKWVWDASSGGAGAGMVISETEPTDKVEGMQWLNPTTGLVLFWDDEKWLQMPTTGAAGKDGADGVDGVDGLWTDNGDTSISYTDGNVGIGTDSPASVVTSASTCLVVSADSTNSASTSFQTANAQWEIGSFENAGGKFGVFNNATVSFPLTIDSDGATTVRQDLDNPYTGTIDADTNMSGLRIWNNASATDLSSGVWFKTGGHWSGVAGSRNGKGGWGTQLSFYTHGDEIDNLTQATERMRIEANGQTKFFSDSGKIGWFDTTGLVLQRNDEYAPYLSFRTQDEVTRASIYGSTDSGLDIWTQSQLIVVVNDTGLTVNGNIYKNGNTPVIATSDMVKAFSKLRDAVKDEDTVESLKESITNWIGGMIEEWESMQAETQEISDE